MVVSRRDFK